MIIDFFKKYLKSPPLWYPASGFWYLGGMKRLHIIILALLVTAFVFAATPLSEAAPKLKVAVKFNQLVYEPADDMSVAVEINPNTDVPDARVSLKIGNEEKYSFARTYFLGNLKKGQKQKVEFSKNSAKNFGLEFGLNPVLVEITERQKVIYKFATDLGLKKRYVEGKLQLALALNIADKPHLNMNKEVTDRNVQKKLLPLLEKYRQLSQKRPLFINFIFSPLLAENLAIIAAGYNLNEASKITPVAADSPTSVQAAKILEGYRNFFKAAPNQLILATYSQVNASALPYKDLRDQLAEGKKIINSVFQNTGTAKRYTTYSNKIFTAPKKYARYLPATKPLLSGEKQAATIRALAYLTKAFNQKNKKMVLVTANMASPKTIDYFIDTAKKQKWLQLESLSQLKPNPKVEIDTYKSKRSKSRIAKARTNYYRLKHALASENSAFNQAKMAIYLAEDKNTPAFVARQLATDANNLLRSELDKLVLKLSPLTLTGREGKVPIRIINNSNSSFKIYLDIKTNGLRIKGNKKHILISPKENLISLPVTTLKGGRHKVLVQLKADGTVLSSKYFYVSTNLPSVFWYYVAAFLTLIAILVLGAFYVRERRGRSREQS